MALMLLGLPFVVSAQNQKVTINVKEVTVDAALTKLFEGSAFEYKFEMQSIVIKKKTEQAESKKSMLSGQVTDKSGGPLPGVAVLLKGTTVGTATDVNGNFKFLVPQDKNTVLVFSFIGMKRLEVPAQFGEPMKVTLEEDAENGRYHDAGSKHDRPDAGRERSRNDFHAKFGTGGCCTEVENPGDNNSVRVNRSVMGTGWSYFD